MALGGGTYISQDKILPGAYFRFVSVANATASVAQRGVVGMAFDLNWGKDNEIISISTADFQRDSLKIFGYDSSAPELKCIREIFLHATMLYAYKLTSGGEKASNDFAVATCSGVRGNELRVVIQNNVDDETQYDVNLYLGTALVDTQTVRAASELLDNDFVTWKKDATLTATAGINLAGGSNGTVSNDAHQSFLNMIESYSDINAIGYAGTEDAVKSLYVAFANRMRDEVGIRLQAVVHNMSFDTIAAVNVKNKVKDTGTSEASAVYWATGVIAGTAVNESATNMLYDGEYDIDTSYTQTELADAISAGEWVLHSVGKEVHVLEDINSFVNVTKDMGEVFKDNQTIRVIDTIATSIAAVFSSKYIGKVPNNEAGRISLWSDIVKIHQELMDIDALEAFSSEDITVENGDSKKSIVVNCAITVINTMTKLYMTTVVA